jgi:hypothetical protein
MDDTKPIYAWLSFDKVAQQMAVDTCSLVSTFTLTLENFAKGFLFKFGDLSNGFELTVSNSTDVSGSGSEGEQTLSHP